MKLNTQFMGQTLIHALAGVPVTLEITIVTLLISVPLAFLMALARIKGRGIGNRIISVYVSMIRSTPVVLQILFLYSLIPTLLNYLLNQVWHLDINIFRVNPIVYAFVVFSLNTTAILSEVFRSALLTVGKGQMEAALCAGLTSWQAYIRIVIPQALVSALPNLCNTSINLLKSTSLAFMMTVKDIMAITKVDAAFGYNYIEAYLVVFVIYIVLCTVVQLLFTFIEKNLSGYKKLVAG
ncbi:MAG: amino acid ABC transporter permease [Eubacteriales bacterium]|nr:amino acid ABC transporter permease [Eubacteriales bacterium]